MSQRESVKLGGVRLDQSPYWATAIIVTTTASLAIVDNYFSELTGHRKGIVVGLLMYVFLHLSQLGFRMMPFRATKSEATTIKVGARRSHKNVLRYFEDQEFRFYAYEVDLPGMAVCFLISLWLGGLIFSDSLSYGSMAIWALLTTVYFWAVRFFFEKHIRPHQEGSCPKN